jgi:ABC-type lipoprotein export system ATPase subunit
VADEPTGSLDPKNAAEVMNLFLEICTEEKVTMLLVTHDKELAARLPIQFECKGLVTEEAQ